MLAIIASDRPQLPAPWRKEQVLEALTGYIEAVARHGPTLLLIEDAHWLAPSTGEFLDMVVDRLVTLPLMLVVTSRPEFEPPWLSQAYRSGELWLAAELHRRRADMLLHTGAGRDDGVIEAELLRAIALARRQGANLFELRAALRKHAKCSSRSTAGSAKTANRSM